MRLAVQLKGWRIDIKSESKTREVARWLAEAVSVVPTCGEPEAELLLQQGITSLQDLAECSAELLSSLPGIDDAGAQAIKRRAAELAREKAEQEAREAQERMAAEARSAQEAASGGSRAAEGSKPEVSGA